MPLAPSRLHWEQLDGLRGLAVLGVVAFHFLLAFAPYLAPGYGAWPYGLIDSPLGLAVNGRTLIILFFAISGFVVAQSAAARREFLPVVLALRYLRLALPVAASLLICLGLYWLLPDAADVAYQITPHAWLKQSLQGPTPSFGAALYEGFIGAFVSGKSELNNALWTVQIELIGSCGILAIYWAVKGVLRWGLLCVWAACAASPWLPVDYLAFALGALLREVLAAQKLPARLAPLALLLGLALGAPGPGLADRFEFLSFLPGRLLPGHNGSIWAPIASTLIVWGVLQTAWLAPVLSTRPLKGLGRLSFSIFLVHVPILYTLCSASYVLYGRTGPVGWLIMVACLLMATLTSASLLEHFVEDPMIQVSDKIRNIMVILMQSLRDGVSVGTPKIKVTASWPHPEPGQ